MSSQTLHFEAHRWTARCKENLEIMINLEMLKWPCFLILTDVLELIVR